MPSKKKIYVVQAENFRNGFVCMTFNARFDGKLVIYVVMLLMCKTCFETQGPGTWGSLTNGTEEEHRNRTNLQSMPTNEDIHLFS